MQCAIISRVFIRVELDDLTSLHLPALPVKLSSNVTSLRKVHCPGSGLVLELGFDAMLPDIIQEPLHLGLAHIFPTGWSDLLLDQVDKVLVKEYASTQVS